MDGNDDDVVKQDGPSNEHNSRGGLGLGIQTACVAVVAIVCYVNSINGDLMYDDKAAVRDNLDIRPNATWSAVLRNDYWGTPLATNESHKSFRPVTTATFRANFALADLEPFGYHCVNIALHAIVSILVLLVCRRAAFHTPLKQHSGEHPAAMDLSLLTALLFATHPIHTEAVSNVAGRAELLSAMFFLLGFLAFVEAAQPSKGLIQSFAWLIVTGVLGTLSLFSKEVGFTLFPLCVAYDLGIRHGLHQRLIPRLHSIQYPRRIDRRCLVRMLFMSVMGLGLLAFRFSLNGEGPPKFGRTENPGGFHPDRTVRFLTLNLYNAWALLLLVFPYWLCCDWSMNSIPLMVSYEDERLSLVVMMYLIMGLVVLSSLGVLQVWTVKEREVGLFGLLLLLVPYLPSSHLILRVGFPVAERVMYLPSVGYCILLSLLLNMLHRTLLKRIGTVAWIIPALILVLYSGRTVIRNQDWVTEYALAESSYKVVPGNAKLLGMLGEHLILEGDLERAAVIGWEAMTADPSFPYTEPYHNLCVEYASEQPLKAEHFCRTVIEYTKDTHIILKAQRLGNLGFVLKELGNVEEAIDSWKQALLLDDDYRYSLALCKTAEEYYSDPKERMKLLWYVHTARPNNSDVHLALSHWYKEFGTDEHKGQEYLFLAKAIELNATNAEAVLEGGHYFIKQKNYDKAEELYIHALNLNPSFSTAHNNLGAIYFSRENYELAAKHFAHGGQRSNLANSLAQLGRLQEADEIIAEALTLNPHDKAALEVQQVISALRD